MASSPPRGLKLQALIVFLEIFKKQSSPGIESLRGRELHHMLLEYSQRFHHQEGAVGPADAMLSIAPGCTIDDICKLIKTRTDEGCERWNDAYFYTNILHDATRSDGDILSVYESLRDTQPKMFMLILSESMSLKSYTSSPQCLLDLGFTFHSHIPSRILCPTLPHPKEDQEGMPDLTNFISCCRETNVNERETDVNETDMGFEALCVFVESNFDSQDRFNTLVHNKIKRNFVTLKNRMKAEGVIVSAYVKIPCSRQSREFNEDFLELVLKEAPEHYLRYALVLSGPVQNVKIHSDTAAVNVCVGASYEDLFRISFSVSKGLRKSQLGDSGVDLSDDPECSDDGTDSTTKTKDCDNDLKIDTRQTTVKLAKFVTDIFKQQHAMIQEKSLHSPSSSCSSLDEVNLINIDTYQPSIQACQ